MNLSLYKIQEEHLQIVGALIENGGEATEEIEKALAVNKEDLQTKAVNYGFIIRQLQGEVSMIDAEIERLSALKASRSKAVEKLKGNLSGAMKLFECHKIESPVMNLSLRITEAVEIEDEKKIPVLKYMKEKITYTPDKALIKEAIKAGEIVPGARLQTNYNLQIK